jgi:hypothetical protein
LPNFRSAKAEPAWTTRPKNREPARLGPVLGLEGNPFRRLF